MLEELVVLLLLKSFREHTDLLLPIVRLTPGPIYQGWWPCSKRTSLAGQVKPASAVKYIASLDVRLSTDILSSGMTMLQELLRLGGSATSQRAVPWVVSPVRVGDRAPDNKHARLSQTTTR